MRLLRPGIRALVLGAVATAAAATVTSIGCRRDRGPLKPVAAQNESVTVPQSAPADEGLGTGGAMDTFPQQIPDAAVTTTP